MRRQRRIISILVFIAGSSLVIFQVATYVVMACLFLANFSEFFFNLLLGVVGKTWVIVSLVMCSAVMICASAILVQRMWRRLFDGNPTPTT